MKRTGKRTHNWVYQNKITNELVLVMKPYKRSIGGTYHVLSGVWKRAGFRPDQFLCVSGRRYDRTEFLQRFEYVSGLNTGKKPAPVELQFETVIYGGEVSQSSNGRTELSLNVGRQGTLTLDYNHGVVTTEDLKKVQRLMLKGKVTVTIKEQV